MFRTMVIERGAARQAAWVLAALFLIVSLTACGGAPSGAADGVSGASVEEGAGYRAVTALGGAYLAVGDGGRIDMLTSDGGEAVPCASPVETRLNAAASGGGRLLAVGDAGVILLSQEENFLPVGTSGAGATDAQGPRFERVDSPAPGDLLCAAAWKGVFFVGGRGGVLLRSEDGRKWEKLDSLGYDHDIVSMASNDTYLFAVTAQSQVYSTNDGVSLSVMDYNETYKGFVPDEYRFTHISALGGSFYVTGQTLRDEGAPVVMMTDTGEIWQPRDLRDINDKPYEEFLPLVLGGVALYKGELVTPVRGEKLLTITDCSACNRLDDVGGEVSAVAYETGSLALVGEGYWWEIRT